MKMQMDLSPLQRLLACIGDPSRYRLLARLSGQRLCVSELAVEVGLSQSCTTRHLQALTAVGLVRPAREGKRVVYALRLEDPEVERLLAWVRDPALAPPVPAKQERAPSLPAPAKRRGPRGPRPAPAQSPVASPTAVTAASLTPPAPAVDGAHDSNEVRIQRPPRPADLEDFLL